MKKCIFYIQRRNPPRMGTDQWHRRICRKFTDRCTQPYTSGLSDCKSAPTDRTLSRFSRSTNLWQYMQQILLKVLMSSLIHLWTLQKLDLHMMYLPYMILKPHSTKKRTDLLCTGAEISCLIFLWWKRSLYISGRWYHPYQTYLFKTRRQCLCRCLWNWK